MIAIESTSQEHFLEKCNRLNSREIAHVTEAVSFLKEAVTLALFAEKLNFPKEDLLPLYARIHGRFFSSLNLITALSNSLAMLLGITGGDKVVGSFEIDVENNFVDGSAPDLMWAIDLAYCQVLLGEDCEEFLGRLKQLLPSEHSILLPLWTRQQNYSLVTEKALSALLYSSNVGLEPFYTLILERSTVPHVGLKEIPGAKIDHQFGVSTAFTTRGIGTGFLALIKGESAIQSFGPQPGDPASFGIWNSVGTDGNWIRACESVEDGGLFPLSPTREWNQVSMDKQEGEISIQIDSKASQGSRFAFFIKGPSLTVNKKIKLTPRSLDRFVGKLDSLNIGDDFEIYSHASIDVEAIPLAGGDYFLGSDYLVLIKLSLKSNRLIVSF